MFFRFVAPVSVLYQKIMTSSVQPSQPVLSFTMRQNQRGFHRLTVRMTSPTVPVKPSLHLPNTNRGRCVSYPACTSSLTAGDPFPPQFPFNHALYEAHDLRDKLPTRRITYRHRVAMHGWVHCSTSPSQVHHFPLALLSTTMPLIIPRVTWPLLFFYCHAQNFSFSKSAQCFTGYNTWFMHSTFFSHVWRFWYCPASLMVQNCGQSKLQNFQVEPAAHLEDHTIGTYSLQRLARACPQDRIQPAKYNIASDHPQVPLVSVWNTLTMLS